MDQIKLLNFADFFFNISKEDLDEEYLSGDEIGDLPDPGQLKIQELIRVKQAELLIEEGRKFKEKYLKLKAESIVKEAKNKFAGTNLALAYRKKSGDEDESKDDEAKKLEMIHKAKGSKER